MDVTEPSIILSQLPEPVLKALLKEEREVKFSPGQQIFKEGDPGDGMYCVKSGQVVISATANIGDKLVFSRVMPGDFFGEMAVLDSLPRSANAIAEGETVLYFIPRDAVLDLLKCSPELGWVFLQRFSARLRVFNRQYIDHILQADRIALIGRFASSVVHDLKNPLTIIQISASLAARNDATPEIRQNAQRRIDGQVERITNLINDLLDYARGSPAAKELPLTEYPGFLFPLVDELQGIASQNKVEIVYENPPPAIKLALDTKRLYRVFYNIMKNAVDAMPMGGTIKLRFQVTDGEVITEIQDNGKGIAPQILEKLFEPFATYGKKQGTGLGLTISRRIIQEHNGNITARNNPQGGAIFSIVLPRP
jgi:signal transduction histidine kinase